VWSRSFAAAGGGQGDGKRKVSGAMDLFEELESYEEKTSQAPLPKAPTREIADAGAPKRVLAKEPKIRGSPRRLAIMSSLLVGKSYLELKQLLPRLHNTGARSAERAVENAKKRAHNLWEVENDHRLVVEQAWIGKGEMAPRIKYHARGRVRKGKGAEVVCLSNSLTRLV
jgi:ribosomal protein L22